MKIFILIKLLKGVYELGSVFKTFTLAAGLENKVINPKHNVQKLKIKYFVQEDIRYLNMMNYQKT